MDENKNESQDPAVDFVERLLKEKNITGVDEEVLDQMKSDLMDRVENHVNAAILERIPTEKIEEFERVIGGGDENAIRDFCRENIPELDEIIASALTDFRAGYLNV